MQLFSAGLRVSRESCDYTRAVVHAKDIMEELTINPVQGNGEFGDGFKWNAEVQRYGELNEELEGQGINLLKIKVKISWIGVPHQEKSIEIVSLRTLIEKENE